MKVVLVATPITDRRLGMPGEIGLEPLLVERCDMKVTDLPVVGFGRDQITREQLDCLIGRDEADKQIAQMGERGWKVLPYKLGGVTVWIDISMEGQLVFRHFND